MSNPFHDFDWSLKSLGKVFGAFILGIVGLAIMAGIVSFAFRTIVSPFSGGFSSPRMMMEESADFAMSQGGMAVSSFSKNIVPPIPGPDGEIIDADAEDYEVHEHNVNYRTRRKDEICSTILALKADEDIVFESANETDRSCYYRFEVPNERADEVLETLADLDPEDIRSNVYTIQRSVEGTTDRLQILQKKLEQTESTLAEAQAAYEELMALATRSRDVENLTELITLKISAIEELAQKQISINEEIERVQQNRSEQLRRIAYTEFSVNVYEERFVDWQQITASWKQEIRNFVDNVNGFTQWVSVRLISFVLYTVAAMAYIAIAFGFLKVLWIIGKKVWKLGSREQGTRSAGSGQAGNRG
ncbi:MAG: hypothetical protein ABIH35_03500 [Patescibacteria group bacterium]